MSPMSPLLPGFPMSPMSPVGPAGPTGPAGPAGPSPPASNGADHVGVMFPLCVSGLIVAREMNRVSPAPGVGRSDRQFTGEMMMMPVPTLMVPPVGVAGVVPVVTVL